MTALMLDGHHGRPVAIDLCHACQTIWFDGYESLQLAPASVLRLFREVSDHAASRQPSASAAVCPRCRGPLRVVKDQQRSTRFEYRTCPSRHGRLISFFNFLREKDFIRPMTPAQLAELTARLRESGQPEAAGQAAQHHRLEDDRRERAARRSLGQLPLRLRRLQ